MTGACCLGGDAFFWSLTLLVALTQTERVTLFLQKQALWIFTPPLWSYTSINILFF